MINIKVASYQKSKYAHLSWSPTVLIHKKLTNTKFTKHKTIRQTDIYIFVRFPIVVPVLDDIR